ncbi:MAG: METTL5 family protein [Halanaeroarchaeum sp.]
MRREIARRLQRVGDFQDPSVRLEQYLTPPDLAAHLVHLAALNGDLDGCIVVDLGAGTGMLALGASLVGASRVVAVELDDGAIDVARQNEARVDARTEVDWVRGDATRPPVCLDDATVLANPPFGAQNDSRTADRDFLEAAASLAAVSYTIHNAGSASFVESFAADNGGRVTHSYRGDFEVPRRFDFHSEVERTLSVEAHRIEWTDGDPNGR